MIKKSNKLVNLNSTLFCMACFQPQFSFLPIFLWSFISLLSIWLLTLISKRGNTIRNQIAIKRYEIYIGILMLIPVLMNTYSIASAIYLITSILCAIFCVLVLSENYSVIGRSIIIFLMLNFVALIIGCISILIFDDQSTFFVYSTSGEYLRFRGLQLEPNHLGFSLISIYILILFMPRNYLCTSEALKKISIGTLMLLVFLTFSPFAYFMFGLVTVFYFWTTLPRKLLIFSIMFFAIMIGIQTERFDQIINGGDNSANLRTWGSLFIAKVQVDKCGILGCGLGSGRSILEDEPLMNAFAAQENLVLPNLFAGAMVEGGYIFAILFFIAIVITCFPFNSSNFRIERRCGLLCFLFLIGYTFTGSFPYDAHLWSVLGLIYFLVRINMVGRTYAKEKIVC